MAGVVAEGTRTSCTITGTGGTNAKLARVVHETWYCLSLEIEALETHDDGFGGSFRNELVHIVRAEPDVAKYLPPSDYVTKHVTMAVQ